MTGPSSVMRNDLSSFKCSITYCCIRAVNRGLQLDVRCRDSHAKPCLLFLSFNSLLQVVLVLPDKTPFRQVLPLSPDTVSSALWPTMANCLGGSVPVIIIDNPSGSSAIMLVTQITLPDFWLLGDWTGYPIWKAIPDVDIYLHLAALGFLFWSARLRRNVEGWKYGFRGWLISELGPPMSLRISPGRIHDP